jgi:tetratricopeptide (TPR) repeat protein
MFSINFNLLSYTALSVGPSVTAVGYIRPTPDAQPSGPPTDLVIPWQKPTENPPVFALLSWHTEISDFTGRDAQCRELERWTNTEHPFSMKFLTGDGGAGKSRLAAHFARQLQQRDWAAGFIDLRKPSSFYLNKEGSLLVIDYPEENREGVTELLRDIRVLEQKAKLRILFLTRQPIENWQPLITDCNALTLMDTIPLDLGGITSPAAYELFNSAQENAAEIHNTAPTPVSKEDLLDWILREPENHRALFIVAAAVQSSLHPEEDVFGYKGREVVDALVGREIANLRRIAESRKIKNKDVFTQTLAMAAIADVVPIDLVGELAAREELELGFPADSYIGDELEAAGLLVDGAVRAPKPDILAAAFTVKVLARNPKAAPEIIWAALSQDVDGGLERLGRLSFDAEITLQMLGHRLGQWLADALEDNVERCAFLQPLASTAPPIGLLSAAIAICKTLLTVAANEERAGVLNNLSSHLLAVGDTAGALEAGKESIEIYRKLSSASPQRYLPKVAMSLNNLSNSLSAVGDKAGALETVKEAVEIRRNLSDASPRRYLPDLTKSLNNLSVDLGAVGDTAGSLEAIKEAVEINRKLSDASSQRYLPDLAMSLNNLSNSLSAVGDTAGGLEAIQEAVQIRHKLSDASPQRYLPDLAKSLSSLSNCLSAVGDASGALDAIKEAVEINRKLSDAGPQRYLPDLAGSLGILGAVLLARSEYRRAHKAFEEGIELVRPFASRFPASPFEELLKNLTSALERTHKAGR